MIENLTHDLLLMISQYLSKYTDQRALFSTSKVCYYVGISLKHYDWISVGSRVSQQFQWHESIKVKSTHPSSRWSSSACSEDDRYMILFGGARESHNHRMTFFNDIHVFDAESKEWKKDISIGDIPEPRGFATMTRIARWKFLLFGGQSQQITHETSFSWNFYGDTYILERIYEKKTPTKFKSKSNLSYHSNINCLSTSTNYLKKKTISKGVFAKLNHLIQNFTIHKPSEQTWIWKWTKILYKGQSPNARVGHRMAQHENQIYVFGGTYINANHTYIYLNDLFCLDLDTNSWKKLNTNGTSPPPRHSCNFHAFQSQNQSKKLIVFGGNNNVRDRISGNLNDLYIYDLETNTWNELQTKGIAPTPSWCNSSVLLQEKCVKYIQQNQIQDCSSITSPYFIIFGGYGADAIPLSCIYVLDIESKTWYLPHVYGKSPSPWLFQSCCAISNDCIVTFGGTSHTKGDNCSTEILSIPMRNMISSI